MSISEKAVMAARLLLDRADGTIISDVAGNRFRKVFAADLEALNEALSLHEGGWREISTAPLGDDDFYLVCCNNPADDRSPFVVRGSIFASARKHPVQHHLSMAYLTHWMPLPAKPREIT